MKRRHRLIFLGISLVVLILLGRVVSNGFDFLLNQFWFTSGLLMLILLSLVDQPFFQKTQTFF